MLDPFSRSRRWVMSAVLPMLFVASPGEALGKEMVAVLNFGSDGSLPDEQLIYLADKVRAAASDALDRDDWLVITRESMHVLQDANDLAACESAECEIELGRMLGADQIVVGNVVVFGDKFRLMLRLYETHQGGLLRTEEMTAADAAGLADEIGALAARLFGAVSGSATTAGAGGGGEVTHGVDIDMGEHIVNDITDQTGFLFVETEPKGATVYINGQEHGAAPVQPELTVGRYVVVAKLGRIYHPAREELELTEEGAQVSLLLEPAYGSLDIRSEPAGAEVWLDGEQVGVTPWTAAKKPSGTYEFELKKPYYLSHSEMVTVSDGQGTERSIRLVSNFGGLEISSQPSGAAVWLNDESTGQTTPATFDQLQPGIVVVKLALEGHGEHVQEVTVGDGRTARVEAELQAKLGLVAVTATNSLGEPCRGNLVVDGVSRDVMTPTKLELVATAHTIRVECGAESGEQAVTVAHNEKTSVEISTVDLEDPIARYRPHAGATRSRKLDRLHEQYLDLQNVRMPFMDPESVLFADNLIGWLWCYKRAAGAIDKGQATSDQIATFVDEWTSLIKRAYSTFKAGQTSGAPNILTAIARVSECSTHLTEKWGSFELLPPSEQSEMLDLHGQILLKYTKEHRNHYLRDSRWGDQRKRLDRAADTFRRASEVDPTYSASSRLDEVESLRDFIEEERQGW